MAKERAIFTLNWFPDLSSPGGPHGCARSAGWHWGRSEGTCDYPQLASMQVVHTPRTQGHLPEAFTPGCSLPKPVVPPERAELLCHPIPSCMVLLLPTHDRADMSWWVKKMFLFLLFLCCITS